MRVSEPLGNRSRTQRGLLCPAQRTPSPASFEPLQPASDLRVSLFVWTATFGREPGRATSLEFLVNAPGRRHSPKLFEGLVKRRNLNHKPSIHKLNLMYRNSIKAEGAHHGPQAATGCCVTSLCGTAAAEIATHSPWKRPVIQPRVPALQPPTGGSRMYIRNRASTLVIAARLKAQADPREILSTRV
jgi:hypothetical protein